MPRSLLRAMTDPMALLLVIAAPIYFAIGDYLDGTIALVALVPVAGVGWLLESRAERALERLRELATPTVTVVRDGRQQQIPSEAVVPDDLLVVREGDVIAADGVLVSGTQLLVDESSLTGESQPVEKSMMAGAQSAISAGTTVLSGRGMASIRQTGAATRYGSIGTLLAATKPAKTPLQRSIQRLVLVFGLVAMVFCSIVIAVALVRGEGWGRSLIAGISLAIAAIPEEFPMVYTLYVGLGAWRLARENALVRQLAAVETLGSTTVICSDKTGTLTLGSLTVSDAVTASPDVSVRALLESAVLACEPEPFDPLEQAIVQYARDAGVDVDALHAGQLVHDYPFVPAEKYLTHVWSFGDEIIVAAKGAVETIVKRCAENVAAAREATTMNEQLAARGLRVIAIAGGSLAQPAGVRETDESALSLRGVVAFSDPLRPGVDDALAQCRAAGIRVIMITGDHPVTAHAVAESLELSHADADGNDAVSTGDEIDAADEPTLDELVGRVNVFARTRPEQKHRLVRALQSRGEVVAMTGDGINDSPALREADIGIAMGQRGTPVAREAASIVLLDDNFATIVKAIRNGRRVYDNLVRAFGYLVAFHPPLLLAASIVPLTGKPLLLLPVHLVLLELIVHPTVSLVFESDPDAEDLMTRAPRSVGTGLLGRHLLLPLMLGLTLSGGVIGLYLGELSRDWSEQHARALAFTALLLGQMTMLLVVRRKPDSARANDGSLRAFLKARLVLAAVLASTLALILVSVYVPPAAHILHLAPLTVADWLVAVGVAALSSGWPIGWRRLRRLFGR